MVTTAASSWDQTSLMPKASPNRPTSKSCSTPSPTTPGTASCGPTPRCFSTADSHFDHPSQAEGQWMKTVELRVDVTQAALLGQTLETAGRVPLPDPATLPEPPIVCFGWPGGGYSRRYFTFD